MSEDYGFPIGKTIVFLLVVSYLLGHFDFFGWAFLGFLISVVLIIDVIVTKKSKKSKENESNSPDSPQPKAGHDYTFDYADSDGVFTSRTIKVTNVNDKYIEGFCYLRDDTRTFRRDRILTGEYSKASSHTTITPSAKKAVSVVKDEELGEEILFTGFGRAKKEELIQLAEENFYHVRVTVTQNLDYLIKGPGRAPKKVAEAEKVGATIITEEEFREMCLFEILD